MPPLKVGVIMISKVKNTMYQHNIFPQRSVLVGLSGGADSIALLHIMHTLAKEYGFSVFAAHINHGLRGESAVRDEEFSRNLCNELGIRFFVKHADVKAYAKKLGISEELAGRQVRYDFFAELMAEHNIEYTATAHHKNDNAETLLMNFMRGSGTGGLCGIPYKRDKYIRPLLDVSRCDIEKYCYDNGLDFVTDETNLDTVYTRNKIRNRLIPEIEKTFNPNFVDTVTQNAGIIRDDEDFLSISAENEYKRIVSEGSADIKELVSLHKALGRRVIRMMIDEACGVADVSAQAVESVYELALKGKTGLSCDIAKNVIARCEYGKLIIGHIKDECPEFSYTIKVGEERYIPQLGYTVSVGYASERENDGAQYFETDDSIDEITVTNRRKGDKFIPSGMMGTKTVKDYMINEKIPQGERSRVGIVRIDGDIAWIIGYRRDERFKFRKKGIKICIIKSKGNDIDKT